MPAEQTVSKTQLAAALNVTKRTLTNYVASGILPNPVRTGRDSTWPLESLVEVCEAYSLNGSTLALDRQELLVRLAEVKTSPSGVGTKRPQSREAQEIPAGVRAAESEFGRRRVREEVISEIVSMKLIARDITKELASVAPYSPERDTLWNQRRAAIEEKEMFEHVLVSDYLPGHNSKQLLSTSLLFCSPLFNVKNNNAPRQLSVELSLEQRDSSTVTYRGPELRQDDSLVFMALVNVSREFKPGTEVCFNAQSLCRALWGLYDGPSRKRLRDSIVRLQGGLLKCPTYGVQLVGRFNYPSNGDWSIVLDRDVVKMFLESRRVWLDLNYRRALSSGLASWLYCYVCSQTRLIPTSLESLQAWCGSEATSSAFRGTLRSSMVVLARAGHVDSGWRIDRGRLHWRKSQRAMAA